MTISIQFNQENMLSVSFSLQRFLGALLKELRLKTGRYEFTFVDDSSMIDLHTKHLNKASTTDIVTFNLNSEDEPDGDIYICVDEAKRNAEKHKQSFDQEIQLLITHGILHLIGYTDYDELEKKRMFDEQDRLLEIIQNNYEITNTSN